jgi:hypothetical protein
MRNNIPCAADVSAYETLLAREFRAGNKVPHFIAQTLRHHSVKCSTDV